MKAAEIIESLYRNHDASREELRWLIENRNEDVSQRLFELASAAARAHFGNKIYVRGLIEMTNYCRNDCYYCGIRRGNRRLKRFQLALPEIVEMAREADEFRYGSVVLQGGERSDAAFVDFIAGAVEAIKRISGGRLGITLSLGEQSLEVYRRWFAAGAHRYLLRLEASNPELYRRLHPADHSYDQRLACLGLLRQAGYQVGSGVMIGLPTQTTDDLVDDLEFFRRTDLDMSSCRTSRRRVTGPAINCTTANRELMRIPRKAGRNWKKVSPRSAKPSTMDNGATRRILPGGIGGIRVLKLIF